MAKAAKQTALGKKEKNKQEAWWTDRRWVSMIIAVVSFLLYSNSLTNGFVLDDSLVITKNSFTTQGVSGIKDIFTHATLQGYYGTAIEEIKIIGGRYRPLSVAFFAFLYQLFGANSFVFHLWNVLLYSLCCVILYHVLRNTFESKLGIKTAAAFSGLTVLLFAVHPIHTEAVNNIKSNDEILSLLFSLTSLFLAVKFRDTQNKLLAWLSGIALFLALLSKESAVVFLAIIPLTFIFRKNTSKKKRSSLMPLLFALGGAFMLYFIIRYSIVGWSLGETSLDLINNPFIKFNGEIWEHCTLGERLAMIFLSLGKYLQLLVFPIALSTDYYPRFIDVITFSNPLALLSLLVFVSIAVYAMYKIRKKQYDMHVYGIVFFLVTLSVVSNLIFPIGTNLAERFLFTPSVGFCIVVCSLVIPVVRDQKQKLLPVFSITAGIILLLLAGRTFIRNFDFSSNMDLLSKDVNVSEKSAKIQNALGSLIAEQALKTQDQGERLSLSVNAMAHLDKAISIHPTYLEAFYMRGNVNFLMGKYEAAIQDYRKVIRWNENFKDVYPNYALAMREEARAIMENNGDIENAISYLEQSIKLYPNEQETLVLLERARKSLQPQ